MTAGRERKKTMSDLCCWGFLVQYIEKLSCTNSSLKDSASLMGLATVSAHYPGPMLSVMMKTQADTSGSQDGFTFKTDL